MRRNGRKEITIIRFKGIAADGGFVFKATVLLPNIGSNSTLTALKATSYADGVMEIAIDCMESVPRVAEIVSGMFSRKSNFLNLDAVILNYRNICLQIGKTTGRKDIICMLMKAMSMPNYKNSNNNVSVDTKTCQKSISLRDSDLPNMWHEIYTNSFRFYKIFEWGKSLWFRDPYTNEIIIISSIKDGIVTIESTAGDLISDSVTELKKFFVSCSNFYGLKALEFEFNQFSIRVDEQNVDRILHLYQRSWSMYSI